MKYSKGKLVPSSSEPAICRSWDWEHAGIDLDTSGSWHRPGVSLGVTFGQQRRHEDDAVVGGVYYLRHGPGFLLELTPPLGEPNRLYLNARGWHVVIGLPSIRGVKETGETRDGVPVVRSCLTWPHLDGISRYGYHRDEAGKWVRDDRPEPWHWGWLTVERKRADG